ncbi:hypothetical protein CgunFtcFv8_026403 [Champsocephalus gunnari]|uniref:Uncharacterized protein n=1 Tax=Champsocephalus gunnari TaxID=52237 RepID=A0AAN8DWY8_CHAGU|nr:hypothetical protein CgunFtcFv8_026403 [Champsocephalus gunnari]
MQLECMQREARTKHEQDKNATAVLRSELHDLRSQFEESLKSHEHAKRSLIEQRRFLMQDGRNGWEMKGLFGLDRIGHHGSSANVRGLCPN